MRILHVFANWKWTGPAEPALNLAWQQRLAGHEVLFLSGSAPEGQESRIEAEAAARGVATRGGFKLSKHARLRANRADAARLAKLLGEWRPEIVHAHLDNDHRIASVAVVRAGCGRLVRTAYDERGLARTLRVRRLTRRALDGLIVVTRSGLDGTLAAWGGSTARATAGAAASANGGHERREPLRDAVLRVAGRPVPVALIEGGVDLQRFDPARIDRAAARARLGLLPDQVAIGIVARVQAHRRFEVLIEALARAASAQPNMRLVVIGRGTQIGPLLLEPVAQRGLGRSVIATGYLAGEEFVSALAALDASIFLVPGSDGTCRALREEMAMGLAPIVTARAPLPDLVEHERSGLVVAETPDGLSSAMQLLVAQPERREALREGARVAARRRFDVAARALEVQDFYEHVLSGSR